VSSLDRPISLSFQFSNLLLLKFEIINQSINQSVSSDLFLHPLMPYRLATSSTTPANLILGGNHTVDSSRSLFPICLQVMEHSMQQEQKT
jgi:hypothetical protein